MGDAGTVNAQDVIRIMVSTDNHLGYAEKDPIRGEDSFIAFEEMLKMAVEEDVDFILLGGDLFHEAEPSQNSLHKCIKLLRQYTFGDKPIGFDIVSDQTMNFHNAVNESVNYEDPNLNISIPVFSIHGNHDDPGGLGRLSSLDLLATTGLVNYFGRWMDLEKVDISPILIQKGITQLALYGLSHIHDARLARLFEKSKVSLECPDPEESEWFHLMVLHQNRADRGPKNYLPEEMLPDFLHLVIWGHEHDCRIEPEYNHIGKFYVSQPGSSVPTSLAEGEALKKFVGLLEIYQTKFKLKPLPLKTVRPFVFESIDLTALVDELGLDEGDASTKVRAMATERVQAMLERSKELISGDPNQPTIPLVRLRLVFTNEEHMFNTIRFGQAFNNKVANPADVVHFKKQVRRMKQEGVKLDPDAMNSAFQKMELETSARVEDLVDRYFEGVQDTKPLQLMPSKILSELCYRLVERHDNNAAESILRFYKEKAIEHLMETMPSEDDITEQLNVLKGKVDHDAILKMLDERGTGKEASSGTLKKDSTKSFLFKNSTNNSTSPSTSRKRKIAKVNDDGDTATTLETTPPEASKTSSGRGRGRGRGARGGGNTTARSTRSAHVMPKLDISVIPKSQAGKQQTLLSAISQRSSARQRTQNPVYEVSDDSE